MKKYYSISEVSNLLGIQAHKLRYLEKTLPKLQINKIKGRRYYTISDMELIKSFNFNNFTATKRASNEDIIKKVDDLIFKFKSL